MQYVVKRGYSYVNPETGKITLPGQPLNDAKVDQSQKWKLQVGELVQDPKPIPATKKGQTFDEATAALVKKRDELTKVRRESRSDAQRAEVAKAEEIAKQVMSDAVKAKKPIEPDDYKFDEMDDGEET